MTRDLTTGSPMRLIAGFTLPTLLGLLFQQLYNLVDTMIVGKLLGSAALAAVGSTGSISFLVIGFCMGICNGFAIPVAQRIGAGEPSKMRRYVANAAYLGAGIAVEKAFQPGGDQLRSEGYRIESLARVAAMSEKDGVTFVH